jgi:hypothetical protein
MVRLMESAAGLDRTFIDEMRSLTAEEKKHAIGHAAAST